MAIRYFGVAGAGSQSGTSYADRAPLLNSGVISTIITEYDFSNETEGLICYVDSGSYSQTTVLDAAAFTNGAPNRNCPLAFVAAPGGTLWTPPDPNWNCGQPIWDTTGMPLIMGTVVLVTNLFTYAYGMRYSSAVNNNTINGLSCNWCEILNTGSGTSGQATNATRGLSNCVAGCTGNGWVRVLTLASGHPVNNVRVYGNPSGANGTRGGLYNGNNASIHWDTFCVFDCPGYGVMNNAAGSYMSVANATIVNCGTGIDCSGTATTYGNFFINTVLTDNSADYQLGGAVIRHRNRIARNIATSVSMAWPGSLDYMIAGSTSEFVDYAGRDFRMKYGTDYWGLGIGCGDEPYPHGYSRGRLVNQ